MLTIEAEDGWLGSPFDVVYRARTSEFPNDYQVQLSDVRIEVLSLTSDGRPKRVRFVFDRDLEDASLRWVLYEKGSYVPFHVPTVGERRILEAVPFSLLTPPPPRATSPSPESSGSR